MQLYKYKALTQEGKTIKGSLVANNEFDLENKVKGLGLELISCKIDDGKGFSFGSPVTTKDKILFCVQLEQLEKAGVPLLEAISDLRDSSENVKLKNMVTDIYEAIKHGSMLSEAMSIHPKVFDSVFTGLIAAGEKTGRIGEVLQHLIVHLKWVDDIQNKIKKATRYPIFLLLLMSGVISVMMLHVIPQLTKFLTSQGMELPVYTSALIATSEFFQSSWYYIFGTPITLILQIRLILRFSEGAAYQWDKLKLKLPYIGNTISKIEIARFCRFFAITYRSGIGILECLDIAIKVVNNRVVRESIAQARAQVAEGSRITDALRTTGQFPSLVARMFKVGEDSGNLDNTLENVNFFYDKEVNEAVNNMVAVISPALTIIMGGIMMWVSIAVFGPLYGSFSKMSF